MPFCCFEKLLQEEKHFRPPTEHLNVVVEQRGSERGKERHVNANLAAAAAAAAALSGKSAGYLNIQPRGAAL